MKASTRMTVSDGIAALPKGTAIDLHPGRPLGETPRTWKALGSFMLKEYPATRYNTNVFTLYRTKAGELRWSCYRDGCFYAYHGKVVVVPTGELVRP